MQLKLKNPNSGYGKNRFSNDKTTKTTKSRCTAKFFQTKIARRVYWKINCSKNSKIQTPDMEKTGSTMTKPQESMHRKIFPNRNRKTRLLENQLQQKLKNPNSGYGKNRFSNDKTTGVDAPQNFSKRKSQDASIGKSIAAKTQKSKFRIWKEQVQQ